MSSEKDVSSQTGETPNENFVIDNKQNINDIGNEASTTSPADIDYCIEMLYKLLRKWELLAKNIYIHLIGREHSSRPFTPKMHPNYLK